MREGAAPVSEEMIVTHCSPTMAGLKTGSLFSCRIEDRKKTLDQIRCLNSRRVPRGADILPLRFQGQQALIYMYRPAQLRRDLSHELAVRILAERKYPVGTPGRCLCELMRRLEEASAGDFPHEIGLFLGYPPEDVRGFIETRAMCAKCVGAWKVYGDEQAAKSRFAKYEQCKKVYGECFRKHNSFDRLIVAVS